MTPERISNLRGLVQHLRARSLTTAAATISEALDEIERLRADLAEAHAIIDDYRAGRIHSCSEHGIAIDMTPDEG